MHFLPSGKRLRQYKVLNVLGAGGFGVTYLVNDETLDKHFAVKEYFPDDFALRNGTTIKEKSGHIDDFAAAKISFLQEARVLARFHHPNIVKVIQIFEANNTAYMVQEYERGRSLKAWLKEIGDAPTQLELDCVVEPLLNALELIHRNNLLHLDVAPDNIMIRDDGTPVLLDFGSAKDAVAQRTKNIGAIIKPGYSPVELYSSRGRGQGPWSEIYSLAATLYCAVTGKPPQEATERLLTDNLVSLKQAAKGEYRAGFLDAIDWGLRVAPKDRPQSITDWRSALFAEGAPVQVSLGDQSNEPSATKIRAESVKVKAKVNTKPKKAATQQNASSDVSAKQKRFLVGANFYVAAAVLVIMVGGIWLNSPGWFGTIIPSLGKTNGKEEAAIRVNENAVYIAAWQNETMLQAYLDTCKICENSSEARRQITAIRQYNEQVQLAASEKGNYQAAQGNSDLLRRYLRECRVCAYRYTADTEIRKIEETATYRAARGNIGLLQAYLKVCHGCEYRDAAKNEIATIEEKNRPKVAAQGGPFVSVDHWESNGSILFPVSYSEINRRTFTYKIPNVQMLRQGVKEGDLFFEGKRVGGEYKGIAYQYSVAWPSGSRCPRLSYEVSGTVSNDERQVTLIGMAPVRNGSCQPERFESKDLVLIFHDKEDNWGRKP